MITKLKAEQEILFKQKVPLNLHLVSCNLQCQMGFPHSLTVMIQIYTLFYDNHDYFIIIVFNPPADSTCLTPVADQSHL